MVSYIKSPIKITYTEKLLQLCFILWFLKFTDNFKFIRILLSADIIKPKNSTSLQQNSHLFKLIVKLYFNKVENNSLNTIK